MSRSKNRPPRLEPATTVAREAAPPTPEARLEHAKVAGAGGSGPGPTELRRLLERMTLNDRRSLGELGPLRGLSTDEAWAAVSATYGATPGVAKPMKSPGPTVVSSPSISATPVPEMM